MNPVACFTKLARRGAWAACVAISRRAVALGVLGCLGTVAGAMPVTLPGPDGVTLKAHWFAAGNTTAAAPHPVVVALHGCGGLYTRKGQLAGRYREYAAWLNARGIDVLMPDSFGSRGLGSQCSTRYGDRSLNVAGRRQDVRAALRWVAAQPGGQGRRVALLGWSNGGTTTLNVLDTSLGEVPPLAGAAVFYPGCAPLAKRSARLAPQVPLLMQLGGADDWTPPGPCQQLADAQRAAGHADVTLHTYPGAYHGFDGTEPLRFRQDVPNGSDRAGVHQGADPTARAQALVALDDFFTRVLALKGR